MNTGQSNVEHNLRIIDGVIQQLAHRFYKFNSKHNEATDDDEHVAMMASKLGYLINISVASTKTWNYEERILELEKERENPIPHKVRKEYMFNPDIMLTIVRDNNGKIMN